MLITSRIIAGIASEEEINAGRRYFHSGAVKLVAVRQDSAEADVEGSEVYAVDVTADGDTVRGTCTCSFEGPGSCKHVVATLFALMYRQADVSYQPDQVPINRRQKKSRERQREAEAWTRGIRAMLRDTGQEHQDQPTHYAAPWKLVYSIIASGSDRFLVPLRVKLRKDGSEALPTLLRSFDDPSDPHFDLADRIIIPKLLTGFGNALAVDHVDEEIPVRGIPIWSSPRDTEWNDVLELLRGKECYRAVPESLLGHRLAVEERAARLLVDITEQEDDIVVAAYLETASVRIPLTSDVLVLTTSPLWVVAGDVVCRVGPMSGHELAPLKEIQFPIVVPKKDRKKFIHEALPRLLSRYVVNPRLTALRVVDAEPVPVVFLKETHGSLTVSLGFRYGTVNLPFRNGDTRAGEVTTVPEGDDLIQIRRNTPAENVWREKLLAHDLLPVGDLFETRIHPLEWLYHSVPLLRRDGFEVLGHDTLRHHTLRNAEPLMHASVTSGIDWFDLRMGIRFEGTEASFSEFVSAVVNRERFVRLNDGTYGVLPDSLIARFQRAFAFGDDQGDMVRLSRFHVGLLGDILDAASEAETDDTLDTMRARLASFSGITEAELPDGFHGALRPYQRSGFDWLLFLKEFRFGGILADDMGLGKTVQALAVLQHAHAGGAEHPSLVIVPTSLIFNWQREAATFTPSLRVLPYSGLTRKDRVKEFQDHDVIVTSYGILRRDIVTLRDLQFHYVILDESQNIKNYVSVNARAARVLRAQHRLALTGTPVENNLTELWSQFAFLNPGMLGSLNSFLEVYARPIEREQNDEAAASLRRLVHPFILRRTKELVATDLPPKTESTVYCEMDDEQRMAYEHWREYFRRSIISSIDTVGLQRSRMKILEGLMKLRLVCCHPVLADPSYTGSSGKFDAFLEMRDDVIAEGHKVLVFSQFVRMLTVMREECDRRGLAYEYLDGKTIDRQARVDRFQTDTSLRLFLISLKAGGTGLNLTAADYVILYDPWWNPAVEMQATDRTHRIGQTKSVFAYRLITKDSVEEKILALQERKRNLVSSIITADTGFIKSLTREDVEELFG